MVEEGMEVVGVVVAVRVGAAWAVVEVAAVETAMEDRVVADGAAEAQVGVAKEEVAAVEDTKVVDREEATAVLLVAHGEAEMEGEAVVEEAAGQKVEGKAGQRAEGREVSMEAARAVAMVAGWEVRSVDAVVAMMAAAAMAAAHMAEGAAEGSLAKVTAVRVAREVATGFRRGRDEMRRHEAAPR